MSRIFVISLYSWSIALATDSRSSIKLFLTSSGCSFRLLISLRSSMGVQSSKAIDWLSSTSSAASAKGLFYKNEIFEVGRLSCRFSLCKGVSERIMFDSGLLVLRNLFFRANLSSVEFCDLSFSTF